MKEKEKREVAGDEHILSDEELRRKVDAFGRSPREMIQLRGLP